MLRMGRQERNTLLPAGFGRATAAGGHVKGFGYLVSTLSVLLLGTAALKGASEEPLLLICLIAGMATSIVGMWLRYHSYRRDDA